MSWLKTINQAWNSNGQSRSFSLCHFSCQKGQEIRFLLAKADKNSPKMTKNERKCSNSCQKCRFWNDFRFKNNCFLKIPKFLINQVSFGRVTVPPCSNPVITSPHQALFKPKSFNFTSFLWTFWFIFGVFFTKTHEKGNFVYKLVYPN